MSAPLPEPVIELGEFRYDAGPPPEPSTDTRWRHPDWHQRVWAYRRRWPSALVGALVLLLLGGGAIAPGSPLERVWDLPADVFDGRAVATDQVIYMLTAAGGDAPRHLEAYRWRDGEKLWSTPLDEPNSAIVWISLAGEIPVVNSGQEPVRITAFDPETGQPRWSHPGFMLGWVANAGVLLGDVDGAGAGGAPEPASPGDARTALGVVDPVSGELRWQRRMNLDVVGYDYESDNLQAVVHLDADGQLTRYDLLTGEPMESVQTGFTAGDSYEQRFMFPGVGGGTVHMSGPAMHVRNQQVVLTEPNELVAYDLDGLEVRWRLDRTEHAWTVPCGEMVCALGWDSGGVDGGTGPVDDPTDLVTGFAGDNSLVGIDPGSGEIRWSRGCDGQDLFDVDSDPDQGELTQACLFSIVDSTMDGVVMVERVLATQTDSSTATWMLDSATGELLDHLELWSSFGRIGDDLLLAYPAGPQTDGTPPDLRWLGRWRADPPGFQVLGQLDVEWCSPLTSKHLACGGSDTGEAGIWRIR